MWYDDTNVIRSAGGRQNIISKPICDLAISGQLTVPPTGPGRAARKCPKLTNSRGVAATFGAHCPERLGPAAAGSDRHIP